jgi:hypothetical protein
MIKEIQMPMSSLATGPTATATVNNALRLIQVQQVRIPLNKETMAPQLQHRIETTL